MKKLFAAALVAMTLFALGTSALAIAPAQDAPEKNPPVFLSGLTVADAWMSGLTVQNWSGALTEQTYVEGRYIWFIAKISVSAYDETDGARLWTDGDEEAVLTITSKDNCLNFSSAAIANFAKISGMDVISKPIGHNSIGLIDARAESVVFTLGCQGLPDPPVVENGALVFPENLSTLKMDGIYPGGVYGAVEFRETRQKDYYLHFMAIANAATEGVCIATLNVNQADDQTFIRDPGAQEDEDAVYASENWWEWNMLTAESNAMLLPGDRSYIYYFDNTVNNTIYSMMKISGKAVANNLGREGPYNDSGSIYVIMNFEATRCYIGFAVSGGRLQGLVYWNNSYRGAGDPGAFRSALDNEKTWDAANYSPLLRNSNMTEIGSRISITRTSVRALFNYFGIAPTNPGLIDDVTFLAPRTGRAGSSRSARETTAEARYNVSSGDSEFDDLFASKTFASPPPTPAPSPTPAPTLTLTALPMNTGGTPSPTPSPAPSPTSSPTP